MSLTSYRAAPSRDAFFWDCVARSDLGLEGTHMPSGVLCFWVVAFASLTHGFGSWRDALIRVFSPLSVLIWGYL